jgi:hypothetical protein
MMKIVGDPSPWPVQEQLASVADVDQSGEVRFTRSRRATSEDNEREDEPEQGFTCLTIRPTLDKGR